jgi:hypothetical protein
MIYLAKGEVVKAVSILEALGSRSGGPVVEGDPN